MVRRCAQRDDEARPENNQNSRFLNPNHTLTATTTIKILSIAISSMIISVTPLTVGILR